LIEEEYFIFYEGEDPLIEAPYFCITKKEAEQQYRKWQRKFPTDAAKLYMAKIIKKPEEA